MPKLQVEPRGAWRKWQDIADDAYTYSLAFTDAAGERRVQNWSYTPNMTPDEAMVKGKCISLEQRIESEGGTFETGDSDG